MAPEPSVPPKPQKLHGRAFYESLGSPKLILAPMVDQSEFAWRLLSRSFFPPEQRRGLLAYSPMLHAKLFAEGWKYRDNHFECRKEGWEGLGGKGRKTGAEVAEDSIARRGELIWLDGNTQFDRPLFVQFCANDPQALLTAAKLVQPYCDAVDLNLGCPQGIAKRGHYGAFLQEDQPLIAKMIRTLHEELDIPVTAKMRILETREQTLEYAKTLLDAGASILTVHGRRREMKGHATGVADWSMIKYLRESLPRETVLFANGNVLQHTDIQRCLDETGVDGVMSAEGNLYDPSIFAGPPPAEGAGEWVDVDREYWVGRDGKGGYRVDAVLRRYLDIVHRYVLGREPPERTPLFLAKGLGKDERAETTKTAKRTGDTLEEKAEHEDRAAAKRQKTASSPIDTPAQTAPSIGTKSSAHPSGNPPEPPPSQAPSENPHATSTDPKVSLSKKQRKALQKKATRAALNNPTNPPLEKRRLEKSNSPNMVAMQAHCFHILRPLVSQHHDVRDALARSRAGDIAAYETVLSLTEAAVREGLLAYERDPAEFEHVEDGDVAEEGQEEKAAMLRSSTAAVNRCKRPYWVCQAYVRPLPHEALEKGSLSLSKKERRRLEDEREEQAKADSEAAKSSGVADGGKVLEIEVGNGKVLVEAEAMVAG